MERSEAMLTLIKRCLIMSSRKKGKDQGRRGWRRKRKIEAGGKD